MSVGLVPVGNATLPAAADVHTAGEALLEQLVVVVVLGTVTVPVIVGDAVRTMVPVPENAAAGPVNDDVAKLHEPPVMLKPLPVDAETLTLPPLELFKLVVPLATCNPALEEVNKLSCGLDALDVRLVPVLSVMPNGLANVPPLKRF